MTKIRKTIRVNAGDTYTLPSNANIISVYTNGSVTVDSTCGDVDTTALSCYATVFLTQYPDDDGTSDALEANSTVIEGVIYNGTFYALEGGGWTVTDATSILVQRLQNTPTIKDIFFYVSSGGNNTPFWETYKKYLVFKSVDITRKFFFVSSTDAANSGAGVPRTEVYYSARPYDDVAAEGHQGFPAC